MSWARGMTHQLTAIDEVTAVRVEADRAENHRRIEEEEHRQDRLWRLQEEAVASGKANAAVEMRWNDLMEHTMPQELHKVCVCGRGWGWVGGGGWRALGQCAHPDDSGNARPVAGAGAGVGGRGCGQRGSGVARGTSRVGVHPRHSCVPIASPSPTSPSLPLTRSWRRKRSHVRPSWRRRTV